ncbi:MAG: hypothetical protein Q7T01_03165 [bacterium]|nr:hypothetical protein [bacterium]
MRIALFLCLALAFSACSNASVQRRAFNDALADALASGGSICRDDTENCRRARQ